MAYGNIYKPVVLAFAGPNGSGKTTLNRHMQHKGVYINADDLKCEYGLTDIEAAQKAEELRNKQLEEKVDFTFETVLSTDRNLILLKKAKQSGYKIECIYVLTCNVDINVARVKSRVLDGGHDVSEDKVRSRYARALELLPQLVDICDEILIYDNSVEPFLVFMKNENGSVFFPSEFWPIEKLKKLLVQ